MHEHFLSSAGTDLFRPFTGRHRAIFFEVVTEIYERTIGVNADYEIVLDRHALNDIIVGALEKNRSLIFLNEAGDDAELDAVESDREYADRVRRRLKEFGILEDYNDATHLKVLWRFTPHGKRIAKMFADTRRKTSVARQRSVRACKAALNSFLVEANHEFLVDAYEYASTIFDDLTQVAELFSDHQRRIMSHEFGTSKEAIDGYLAGVRDFDKRAARYFDSDNIYNHAGEIIDLTHQIENLELDRLRAIDTKIAEENPALDEEANGEPVHLWMLRRIRRIVESTRDIKHGELHRVVGEFSTKYAILIFRLIKLSSSGADDPIGRFTMAFASADAAGRDELARELLWHVFPLRADIVDPMGIKLPEYADRRQTPTEVIRHEPTRQDRLDAKVRTALTEAFAISSGEIFKQVKEAAAAGGGATTVSELSVEDARSFLAALSAVEIVRGAGEKSGLTVSRGKDVKSNGVFTAVDHKISERA